MLRFFCRVGLHRWTTRAFTWNSLDWRYRRCARCGRREIPALLMVVFLTAFGAASVRADEISDCIRDRASEWFDSSTPNTLHNTVKVALDAMQACGASPEQTLDGFEAEAQRRIDAKEGKPI